MQVFANKCLFSPNFRKHFFGGFGEFQELRREKKLFSTIGAFPNFLRSSVRPARAKADAPVAAARGERAAGIRADSESGSKKYPSICPVFLKAICQDFSGSDELLTRPLTQPLPACGERGRKRRRLIPSPRTYGERQGEWPGELAAPLPTPKTAPHDRLPLRPAYFGGGDNLSRSAQS